MMTCPKCGKEVPEGALTCPECGFELSKNADSSQCPDIGTHCEPSPSDPVSQVCDTGELSASPDQRPVRRVPNIPRREPDSLPERPGQGTGYTKWPTRTILMLIAAAAVIAFLVWAIK